MPSKQSLRDASEHSRGAGRPAADDAVEGRQLLLDAAREVLADHGVDRLTLKEVAERAGVRPPLVRYHFGNKAGLLREVTTSAARAAQAKLREISQTEGPFEERFRASIVRLIETLAADPYLPRLFFEQIIVPDNEATDRFASEVVEPSHELFAALIDEGVANGRFRPVDSRLAVPSIFGLSLFYFLSRPLLERLYGEQMYSDAGVEAYGRYAAELLSTGLGHEHESGDGSSNE
jgi:TetR/AcrR family transcriptional regulator